MREYILQFFRDFISGYIGRFVRWLFVRKKVKFKDVEEDSFADLIITIIVISTIFFTLYFLTK